MKSVQKELFLFRLNCFPLTNPFYFFKDKEMVLRVLKVIDKANGYALGTGEERNIQTLLSYSAGADFEYFKTAAVMEKYIDSTDKDTDKMEKMDL